MIPVFANSAWVQAPERLILRGGGWHRARLPVRYGLFVHPVAGPVLIDTGYTAHSLHAPGRSRWLRAYGRVLAPQLNDAAQPAAFLGRMGLQCADITTVIVTHFHVDHVSGLAAFPRARFVCSDAAWTSLRNSPDLSNIRHGIFPELLPPDFASRLDRVEDKPRQEVPQLGPGHDLFGDGSVVSIPLPGHAAGHLGLCFGHLDPPLLYATDTQWLIRALPRAARARLAPRLISQDHAAMQRSADRVDAFRRAGGTVMLCHDDLPARFDEDAGAGR